MKQDKDIRLMEINKEILYYSEMLTNKYQDSRIDSINGLAEQERRLAAFELQRQYARELQRLETEEFEKVSEINGRLRLKGLPLPVDPFLLNELAAMKKKRERLCDEIVSGLDVGQRLGTEMVRLDDSMAERTSEEEEHSITLFKTTEELEEDLGRLDEEIQSLEKRVNLARAD